MIRPGRRPTRLAGILSAVVLLALSWYIFAQDSDDGAGTSLAIPVGDYAPGTVRQVEGFWVVRQPSGEFYVFLDHDPHRGQPLNWVESAQLFIQAAYYRMDGSCVTGPCDARPGQGLYRVESRLEGDTLAIYPKKVISGGFDPEPSWLTDLKHFFMFRRPAHPLKGPSTERL